MILSLHKCIVKTLTNFGVIIIKNDEPYRPKKFEILDRTSKSKFINLYLLHGT